MEKKNKSIRRILAYLLTVCICIGGIPIAYALGDEQSADSMTLLTYNDARTEVDVFEPSEEFYNAWSLGVEMATGQLTSEGYENLEAANEKDVMIYVSKEDCGDNSGILKTNLADVNNMEEQGLEKYDGKGGSCFIWRLYKGAKAEQGHDVNIQDIEDIQENLTKETVEYFWIRTESKIDLQETLGDFNKQDVTESETTLQHEKETISLETELRSEKETESETKSETEPETVNESAENDISKEKTEKESESTTTFDMKKESSSIDMLTNAANETKGTLSNVFLNGTSGNDSKDGTTPTNAVKTFTKAKELLGYDGTIWISGSATVVGRETWTLEGYGNAKVKRWIQNAVSGINTETFKSDMVIIDSDDELILENIVIDGGSGGTISSLPSSAGVTWAQGSLVSRRNNAKLIINNGAILENNFASDRYVSSTAQDYAVEAYGGGAITSDIGPNSATLEIITMNGGEIRNCLGTLSGAFYHDAGGILTINGGKIHDNKGGVGHYATAGITRVRSNGVVNINGGELYRNIGNRAGGIHIYDSATVNITGGKMYENRTADDMIGWRTTNDFSAGFLFIHGGTGVAYMSGGEIYDNKAITAGTHGSDLFAISGGVLVDNYGKFYFSGGSIHDNKGGGISYSEKGTWASGGLLASPRNAQIFVKGSPRVYNNYTATAENDYTEDIELLEERNALLCLNHPSYDFQVEGALSETAQIGITAGRSDVAGYAVANAASSYKLTQSDLDVFTNDRYESGKSSFDVNFNTAKNSFVLGASRGRTYYANYPVDMSGASNSIKQNYTAENLGTTYTFEESKFTLPDNYLFTGWNTKADGSGVSYSEGEKLTTTISKLYGVWKIIPTFAVDYELNGATGGIPITSKYEEGASVTVGESSDMVPPADKVFDYWESNISVSVNGTSTTKLNPKDTFVMPAKDIILKAVWKNAKTDITFEGFEDGSDALLKVKNEAGKVNSKALPKIKINGADATLEDLEKMTYSYERYVRTGSVGKYTYGWSGNILQEGINDIEIQKLPLSIKKPTADNVAITASTKKSQSGIVKLTISYNGNENSQASCIIVSAGDVDLNSTIRASDVEMLEAYINGDPSVKLDQYIYQKIMGDLNSEATTGTIRITTQDVELLEAIIVN